MVFMNNKVVTVRIEYTKDNRKGVPSRLAKECSSNKVEKLIEKLTDRGCYNFECKYELL